jgi:hypothetical protein
VPDQSGLRLLRRDRQDASNLVDRRRLAEFEEVHEGLDRGEPNVSGAGAIRAGCFQMIQEVNDKVGIDLLEAQGGGSDMQPLTGILQE